ncbi:MAG: hypothetical protein Kow00121_35080 [Elainellaceae cyanobacterium]
MARLSSTPAIEQSAIEHSIRQYMSYLHQQMTQANGSFSPGLHQPVHQSNHQPVHKSVTAESPEQHRIQLEIKYSRQFWRLL